jgi:hypothetical protein
VPSPENFPASQGRFGITFDQDLTWTDVNGKLWLLERVMWRYDPSTTEWTWMSGDPQNGKIVYGTKGVPSADNFPGSTAVASWRDKNGMLWLYRRDELWRYNTTTNEWTWMSGEMLTDEATVYGQKGVPSVNNTPGL